MKLLLILLFVTAHSHLSAQTISSEVIASQGGEYKTNNSSLSFTVGEISSSYYKTTSTSLSEGFHQTYADVISAIEDLEEVSSFKIFPNPTSDIFHLQLEGDLRGMKGALYNLLGRKMNDIEIDPFTLIDMTSFSSGTYFLRITDIKNRQETISIIKS